jgi:cell division inhibitor SulA/protein ImuA
MSVEDLLAHPLLWRGQDGGSADTATIATGFTALDRYLPGGGWPLTGISEIFIERYGLGELSILMPALAALSRRAVTARQWIVWIAPPFVPYAPALAHHGVDLSRILLVHPAGRKQSGKGADPDEALWAVEQVIRSQSSVAVLAWVREADVPALRRLQLGAEAYRCWTVLFRPLQAVGQSSPAALRFSITPTEPQATILSGAAVAATPVANQIGIQIEIHKCRGRRPRSFLL